jgi:hypothetical protein
MRLSRGLESGFDSAPSEGSFSLAGFDGGIPFPVCPGFAHFLSFERAAPIYA